MTDITVKQLREKAPPGYNLAAFVPLGHDINDLSPFVWGDWSIVLAEARGALGVLRALDAGGRRPGVLARMEADGLEHRLLHLEFTDYPGEPAILSDYKFKITI